METIRIYRTNVNNRSAAETITGAIHQQLPNSSANFDLKDWDKVLRVECPNGKIDEAKIKGILHAYGYKIKELPWQR